MTGSRITALALVALLAMAASAPAQSIKNATTGSPKVQSIQAIGFAPDGVLLIGDGKGAQVVAVQTGDTQPKPWAKTEIPNIQSLLGERLGAQGKGIEIVKMAVNPASQTAYFVVRIQQGKHDAILTVDGTGKVSEFSLENVPHVIVSLPADEGSPVTTITDVTWAGDRVLVSALAKATFASKVLSIPTPLTSGSVSLVFSTETYHVAHGRWETNAPIRTVIPYEEDGKRFLVGTFTCTPIVKYPLDQVQPGAKVKGVSVIELGNGNQPLDMFAYDKGGKKYILMNHIRKFHAQNPVGPSPYWVAKIDYSILKENEKVNQKAIVRVKGKASENLIPQTSVPAEYHGTVHMDRLNNENALVVRTTGKDTFNLVVLPLP